MRWRGHGVGLALAVTVWTAAPALAAPLLGGLGGEAGYGPDSLWLNDDESTGEIDIRGAFPMGLRFFGMSFTSLYLNNNGNVTFGGPLGTYTPQAFPVASQRMIAPWWGDVDTRGGGRPARNGVYWSITPGRFVATWHDVGYFSTHDDLQNDFQLILTAAVGAGPQDFDVEFRYNRCQWTTGDASGGVGGFGGTPAQAGFDAGDLRNYVSLPGSLTMEVLRLCDTSNVGMAGVWRFAIRDGDVTCAGYGSPCTTGLPGACSPGTIRCRGTASVCIENVDPMPESCNGVDDNCDGTTDEGLGASTCGIGACEVTMDNCVGGRVQTCVPGAPSPEACNLVDDDCNTFVDDMEPLGCGVGGCIRYTEACIDGVAQTCVPGLPSPETCNGIDDDCNNIADDTLDACVPPDTGPPDAGRRRDGSVWGDGGHCRGCNPFRINGRAGPGCDCRALPGRGSGSPALLALLALALLLRRRR